MEVLVILYDILDVKMRTLIQLNMGYIAHYRSFVIENNTVKNFWCDVCARRIASVNRKHFLLLNCILYYSILFLSGTRAKILIGASWGLSFLFSLPTLILSSVEHFPETPGPVCVMMLPEPAERNWKVGTFYQGIIVF